MNQGNIMSLLLDVVLFLREKSSQFKLSPVQKVILFMLAGHIGKNKEWIIKQTELAKECELSLIGLKQNIKALIDKKIVTVTKITTKNGKQNSYSLNKNIMTLVCGDIPSVDEGKYADTYQEGGTRYAETYQGGYVGTYQVPCGEVLEPEIIQPLTEQQKTPKETYKIKHKDKETIKKKFSEKIILPEWLPENDWNDFLDHRAKLKAPMSIIAQRRGISSLMKLKEQGNDISEVLDQSIVNGWKGFFAVRKTNGVGNGQSHVYVNPRAASVKSYWDSLNGTS